MQTFFPYEDIKETAQCLDRQRLGKQRLECWQILRTLRGETKGWAHHPAVRMWQGFEYWLCTYAIIICGEWIERGYNDSMMQRFNLAITDYPSVAYSSPSWWGSKDFHGSHRAMLYRKDPVHYEQFEPYNNLYAGYVWPV